MAWRPFEYRDFWEVPRLIVLSLGGVEYLLDSEFDEVADGYAAFYKVYRMPPSPDPRQPAPEQQSAEDPVYLGSIRVDRMRFDPSLRAELDDAPLMALLRHQVGPASLVP